ncbi:putative component of toxin-antitoxin plasmid stabilization module [Trueperella bonasi]|uniref:Component of toxin-antitoxin plasmid stabilization module n=1 Tax=Trueperella bonasi TaxID=312286 RepID=A0ABT9NI40_9ACTO|nr:putative component of toxin-antitoxin plasmid stabilization module [Trueperella bonasi]
MFVEILTSCLFDAWLDKLKDKHAQRRISYALARCEAMGE